MLSADREKRGSGPRARSASSRARDSSQSAAFLRHVAPYQDIIILTHDNPDPDAISSGWALSHLIAAKQRKAVRFIAGGEIVRAENRKMVSLLRPPIELCRDIRFDRNTLFILIDCSETTANHPPVDPSVQPVIVIDHHVRRASARATDVIFQDLRSDVAATASIAASYLREQKVPLPENLASALVYAIRTETTGGQTCFSPLDREMLSWLTGQANPSHVAEIADAPVAFQYYGDLVLALQSVYVYGDNAFCLLPQAHGPETVGEVADLLIRCEGLTGVLCGTIYRGNLVLSIRTERTSSRNAAKLTVKVLEHLGHGGGHAHRAGGIIHDVGPNHKPVAKIQAELRRRWLAAWGVSGRRGTRLVNRRNIMQCL